MHDSSSELERHISGLSDGRLFAADAERLNSLLKNDPIAQEAYLDHLLLDALLEMEFAGTPAIASQRSHSAPLAQKAPALPQAPSFRERLRGLGEVVSSRKFLTPLALGTALGVFVCLSLLSMLADTNSQEERMRLPIADAGFERPGLDPSPVPALNQWYGDEVEIVGPHDGIVPVEGSHMVRFVESELDPSETCDLYQTLDLSAWRDEIASGHAEVEVSSHFNAVESERGHNYAFRILAYPSSDRPQTQRPVSPLLSGQELSFSGEQTQADRDASTWQQVTTRMPLPADTRYLLIQLAIVELHPDGDPEFPGHFADNVALNLVSTP